MRLVFLFFVPRTTAFMHSILCIVLYLSSNVDLDL